LCEVVKCWISLIFIVCKIFLVAVLFKLFSWMLNQVIVIVWIKMDEDQLTYYSVMSKEVDMDFQDEQDCGVNEGHVDCSDVFNTSQVIMSISFSCLV